MDRMHGLMNGGQTNGRLAYRQIHGRTDVRARTHARTYAFPNLTTLELARLSPQIQGVVNVNVPVRQT
eukprot:1239178-Pleurochrysis_carterae.AAC.1